MKKNYITILVIIVSLLIIVCTYFLFQANNQKSNVNINIDSSMNGQSINVKATDTLNITLSNPGSGGYQFDDPIYDTNLLKLLSHDHTDPKNNKMVGNFGEDIWKFEAIKSGQTDIIFNISRPWEQQKEIDFQITVNIE